MNDEKLIRNTDDIDYDTKSASSEDDWNGELRIETNEIAIVDASVLEGIENPLIKDAIFIPTKSNDVIFSVSAQYDTSSLINLTIEPKIAANGNAVTKEYDKPRKQEIIAAEGTFGNDDRLGKLDPTPEQIRDRHTKNDPTPGNILPLPDPTKRIQTNKNNTKKTTGISYRRSQRPNGRRAVKAESNSIINIIAENMGQEIPDISSISNKYDILECVDMLIAMSKNDWYRAGNTITNGTYRFCEGVWSTKDGRLLKNKKPLDLDFEWLYEFHLQLNDAINEQNNNINELVEKINARSRF